MSEWRRPESVPIVCPITTSHHDRHHDGLPSFLHSIEPAPRRAERGAHLHWPTRGRCFVCALGQRTSGRAKQSERAGGRASERASERAHWLARRPSNALCVCVCVPACGLTRRSLIGPAHASRPAERLFRRARLGASSHARWSDSAAGALTERWSGGGHLLCAACRPSAATERAGATGKRTEAAGRTHCSARSVLGDGEAASRECGQEEERESRQINESPRISRWRPLARSLARRKRRKNNNKDLPFSLARSLSTNLHLGRQARFAQLVAGLICMALGMLQAARSLARWAEFPTKC